MFKTKLQQLMAALLVVALVIGAFGVAVNAAPASQEVRAQKVTGTIDGAANGEFPKIWLGLETEPNNQTATVTIEWDRFDTDGIGFYLLDETGLKEVQSGSKDVREANLAVSQTPDGAPGNIESASFKATGTDYTIVVFNDSPQAASFTLSVDNGFITNGDGSVVDANAPAKTDETTEEAAPVSESEPVTATVTTTTVITTTTTTAPEPATTVAVTQQKVVRATEVKGELPTKDSQHYLGLVPDARDADISLTLSYDPQDSQELARRLNFWVLDEQGFKQYAQGGARLSTIAIAAGSTNVDTAANERMANFKASGEGDYTVIVYNSSDVPATYTLTAKNAMLVDDSGQTLTAQEQMTATIPAGATTAPAAGGETTAPAAAAKPAKPASTGAAGEPGGTYTVKSGDTLAIIARDVYGDFQLYEELCAYNDIEDCNVIEVGDVIKLPTEEELRSGATAPAAAPAATTTPVATATPAASSPVSGSSTVTETTAITDTGAVTETGAVSGTEAMSGTTKADENAAEGDIIDVLVASGNYKNLVAALEAAGLVDALRAEGPFTLFAPTDAAFSAFDKTAPGVVAELLTDPTGQLTQILLYHAVSGEYTTADITDGLELTTLQGKSLTLRVDGDVIGVNSATVSDPDLMATNGVVQGIDNILLPPTE